ncbi:MAG TPA: hypothetical protein VKY27_10345 [Bacteriovoracaceae bacterium]|nr:hypothetical protein [Bacteriovoracaceae bacterium]
MQRVNIKNWNYAQYQLGNLMAMISFGAAPSDNEQDFQMQYFVTVLENERLEKFQKEFSSLNEACLYINEKYGDWEFKDLSVKGSGCSSCAAH